MAGAIPPRASCARAGYTGTLRAAGDVLVDQVPYMKRCGFDDFAPNAPLDQAVVDKLSSLYPGALSAHSGWRRARVEAAAWLNWNSAHPEEPFELVETASRRTDHVLRDGTSTRLSPSSA
jgi:hypothetical protein